MKIGISSGKFLCELATFYSDRLFVGVELKAYSSQVAAKRIRDKELTNVVVVNMEAHHYVRACVNDQAFDTVHIYFPTPYPYSIGLPHKLINPRFLAEVHRILKPFGILRVVTDHKEYYEEICDGLYCRKWWALEWQPLELTASNYLIGTQQELLHRKEKHPELYALQLVRINQ